MNLTELIVNSPWMKTLGWTFVHSIWQIAAIGILLYILLRCIPGRSAHTRYTLATMALWMIVMVVLSTFIIMLPESHSIDATGGNIILQKTTASVSLTNRLSIWIEARIPMLLTIWLGGVAILMLRLVFSLGWVGHLRKTQIHDVQLDQTLHHVLDKLKVRAKAIAAESSLVKAPLTIGHLKPLILFPVGLINQLTPAEVEAILTHELAHIVRRDYLSNLIQSFIETIFYYHPVTWWISRIVRTERENRADDLAVSWCGDHLGYARALMTVQEMQLRHTPVLTVGFSSRKGAMLARIQRILNLPQKNQNQMEKIVLLSLCSLSFLAFTFSERSMQEREKEKKINNAAFVLKREPVCDTIPVTGTYRIHKKTDDQDVTVEVEDGNVKELTVNGKPIAPSEFKSYDNVVNELFGMMTAPVPTRDFMYAMPSSPEHPPVPPMPPTFDYDFDFTMPPMPDMQALELERYLEADSMRWFGNGNAMAFFGPGANSNVRVITDSMANGQTRVIIIEGNDSSIICSPHIAMGWSGEGTPAILNWPDVEFDPHQMEELQRNLEIELKDYNQNWKQNQEEWTQQYREQAEEMRRHELEWQEKHRDDMQQWRDDMNKQRREMREQELRTPTPDVRVWGMPAPSRNLADELVRDGLIRPGEEVEVQLTPGKMKIDGKRVDDETHEKYLKLYERQQGIELSGNSKVEFRTKSKMRM